MTQLKKEQDEILAADPSAYDFDAVYDRIKEEKEAPIRAQKEKDAKRESKYINALLATADRRKFEQERVLERRLLREREKDDHLHAGKEKFVSESYKAKLIAQQQWDEEDRKQEEQDRLNDVTKQTDRFSANVGFMRNMLDSVADGTGVAKDGTDGAVSAKEFGTKVREKLRQEKELEKQVASVDVTAVPVAQQCKPEMAEDERSMPCAEGERESHVAPITLKRPLVSEERVDGNMEPNPTASSGPTQPPAANSDAVAAQPVRRNSNASINDARARYEARKKARMAAAAENI